MKRIVAIALALAMALSLTACGNGSGSGSSAGSNPSSGSSVGSSGGQTVDYPAGETITLICPWAAGGGSDVGVRMLVPYLEEELGTAITVTNPTGGSGWIGWEQMLQADADGLTISLVNWPTLLPGYLDPAYERDRSLDDFQLIANQITDDCVIVIKKDETRFTNAQEFFEYAKNNEVTFGTTGFGTDDHILMCKLNDALGTQLVQVASTGWADNSASIQGGHIDASAGNVGEVAQLVASGELIALCVFAEEENELLPGVPTFDSLGLCDTSIVNSSQRGYAVKAGTDPAIVEILETAFENAINNPELVEALEATGLRTDFIGAEEYTKLAKAYEEELLGMADIMGWDL